MLRPSHFILHWAWRLKGPRKIEWMENLHGVLHGMIESCFHGMLDCVNTKPGGPWNFKILQSLMHYNQLCRRVHMTKMVESGCVCVRTTLEYLWLHKDSISMVWPLDAFQGLYNFLVVALGHSVKGLRTMAMFITTMNFGCQKKWGSQSVLFTV